MAANDEAGASNPNEVFILDMRRADGTRFVTSTSNVSGIERARIRHNGVSAQVAHWKRDRETLLIVEDQNGRGVLLADWRLAESFAL